jgi:hypothetical protein
MLGCLFVPGRAFQPSKMLTGKARGRIHNTSFSSELTNWLNKLVLHYCRLEMLVRDKHFSLLGPFVCYEKIKCCEYAPWSLS